MEFGLFIIIIWQYFVTRHKKNIDAMPDLGDGGDSCIEWLYWLQDFQLNHVYGYRAILIINIHDKLITKELIKKPEK